MNKKSEKTPLNRSFSTEKPPKSFKIALISKTNYSTIPQFQLRRSGTIIEKSQSKSPGLAALKRRHNLMAALHPPICVGPSGLWFSGDGFFGVAIIVSALQA